MLRWLWDCLFPIQCMGCHKYDTWLCQHCLSLASSPGHCRGLEINRPAIRQVYWLGEYQNKILRTAIHGLKYQGWQGLAQPLGQALVVALAEQNHVLDYDWIIPVPLHRRRERERGFNQSDLLAQSLPWPKLSTLERYRWTDPQAQLDRIHRQTNITKAFRVRSSQIPQLRHATALLIDDVLTTGATTHVCAELLQQADCQHIDVAVLARD